MSSKTHNPSTGSSNPRDTVSPTPPGSPNSSQGTSSRRMTVSPNSSEGNSSPSSVGLPHRAPRYDKNNPFSQMITATGSGELFERMRNAIDSTGVHGGMTLMFHVGRFSASSYLNKLWSCVCIADFLLQGTNQSGVEYPMASIFQADSKFDSSFKKLDRSPKWWRDMSLAYDMFRLDILSKNSNLQISGWKNFLAHFRIATDLLVCFADACKRTVDNPSIVTPNYLCDQLLYLDQLVAGQNRDQLREIEKMVKLVTPDRLASAKRGENVPKLEWKTTKRKRDNTRDNTQSDFKGKEKKKRKIRKPRVRDTPSNPQHFEEDNGIARPNGHLTSSSGLIFSEGVTEFEGEVDNLPMICIETFRNEKHEVVTAPVKYRTADGEKSYEAGAEEYMNMESKKLSEVVVCPTTRCYVYFFRDAHLKTHFVCAEEEAREYLSKVMKHDVEIKKIPLWKLKDPLKLITDLSMVDGGLEEGDLQESDFMIVPEGTDLFAQHFGKLSQINFPTSTWMEYFDMQEEEEDKHGRGFRNGHYDCGWTREGVSSSTHSSQDNGIESLVAKPGYMGKDELVSTLGPIMDQTTRLMDMKCFEDGEKLMNNEERDTEFGQKFRKKLGANCSRFDAATVVRQEIPSPRAVTMRHVDSHNCSRRGYRVVAVFSFLCRWNGKLYRVSIIMYTRGSVGNYVWRNYLARKLRQKLRDHVVERNGGLHYQDFSLTDDMGYLQQANFKDDSRPAYFLIPSAGNLSESFFERNPDSRWKNMESQEMTDVRWLNFDLDGTLQYPLEIIVLPEFDGRFGFVSSFASQINRFVDNRANPVPDEIKFQLIYIALMSTSQIQFYYVLEQLIKDRAAILEDYQKSLGENLTDVTLFRRYQRECKNLKFTSMVGGPYNRWQAPPTTHELFRDEGDVKLRENLAKIPSIIQKIEDGTYLNADGVLTTSPGTELLMIGAVSSLSFAPLVVFTKCASSEEAINTAKQSLVNTTSSNTYYNALVKFLEEEDDSELKMKKDDKFVYRLFKAIAKGWRTVIGTIENVCCAAFRKKDKYDVFFRGQDLFILDDTSNRVKVKKYNSEVWTDLHYD